jgi:molecular chaperone DnaK (HSP70)
MANARYSIGIDLGTTNTALAFAPLAGQSRTQIVAIPQLESAVSIVEAPTLPSFLYLPEDATPRAAADDDAQGRWVIGRLARARATEAPGRVVHSAKSWLAHHSADRTAPFLPWGSDDIDRDERISPVTAAALILRYVREAWNDRFAAAGGDGAFDAQLVTITVPASFDAVAQRLTLDAAAQAGYPETVRLLEEPQAALYRWLELNDPTNGALGTARDGGVEPRCVLVVDIGGGTSDFSLFAFHANGRGAEPPIERIAVSEHLLLGGDNMDLALAHRLEPQLADDGENLSARQWAYLVARCRDIKESALSVEGSPDELFSVAIPGRGSRLIAQARSAQISRAEIERLLLDGFFPECSADEYPVRTRTALRELGLPYVRDAAITRHLADFLRDRPVVDAVLFNGGALYPNRLRQRIRSQIGSWQSGALPAVLVNSEPDLAVACGAARFGKLVHAQARRIEAGSAHAIFLHAHRANGAHVDESTAPALVCVLAQGAPTEQTFAVADLGLELRVNVPVRFQTFSSARHAVERVGDIVAWNDRDFVALPALEAAVRVADAVGTATGTTRPAAPAGAAPQTVPVRLTTRVSELGRLEIACVSTDPRVPGTWPLDFNLRLGDLPAGASPAPSPLGDAVGAAGPNVAADALDAARLRLATLFKRPIDNRDKLTASRLLKSLETILGAPRSQWNVVLVRSLWGTLDECLDCRARSSDHEEAWLILAGFLLRPGFGAAMDEARIDRLWTVRETGLRFAAKSVKIQEYVLWRRVAGGLSRERQDRVLDPELPKIRAGVSPPPELVLLAGSLERIGLERKTELIERFIELASSLEREHKHNAHFFAALGSLLNRAPLYGGPEIVVPPELVQRTFDAFSPFDWAGPTRLDLQMLFLRAARVVDNRGIDVSRSLRGRIADKLEKAGVPPAKTAPLKDYMPMQRAERAGNFGEALPPGLILRDLPG